MQVRILQVLGNTLRFRDGDLDEQGSRPIDEAGLRRLLEFSETAYRVIPDPTGDHLKTLVAGGKQLFQWLDGPEQWVGGLLRSGGMALHIDVASKLRHLPWELLFDGMFLCGNPHRLFTPIYRVGLDYRAAAPGQTPTPEPPPANRPLRVLFMASSPEEVPGLDFEAEESMILENTRNQPIELEVEESGCLEWLGDRVASHPAGAFDVVHITGHAEQTDKGPRFILENDVGGRYDADAREIADAFGGRFPRLLFLSGCETAKAGAAGAMPSLAEELVRAGCPAVLGWALPVGDLHASVTGAALYEHLAIGGPLADAVASARQKLLEAGSPHWHLLRLYADDTPLGPLVTPKNTPSRLRLTVRPAQQEFFDAGQTMEVCSRGAFVGRRRLLQQGLRCLGAAEGTEACAEGLLLTGMGGLGKSSLAARLAERMPEFRRVVVVGKMDESSFRAEVRRRITDRDLREILEADDPLQFWLGDILRGLKEPVLFVFDDFDKNRHGDLSEDFRPTPAAAQILNVLARSIRDTASPCRIIVTCRFRFALAAPCRLEEVPLLTMRDADLRKKLGRLKAELSERIAGLGDAP